MSHRLSVRLLAAMVAAAVLAAPTAAHAERVVTTDPAGDVVRASYTHIEGEEPVRAPAPDVTTVDVTRTVVNHGEHRLRVTLRYRDLRRTQHDQVVVRVRTPDRRFFVLVVRHRRAPQGEAHLLGRGEVECSGLRSSFDDAADRASVSVPTSCLGSPRWVQVGVAAQTLVTDGDDPEQVNVFLDDAHRDGFGSAGLRQGPRVRRG